MKVLYDSILKQLGDENLCFVLPSGTLVRSVCQKLSVLSEKKIIATNRFLAWDDFKNAVFSGTKAEKPVNALARKLFAYNLLSENAEKKFLSSIVNKNYAHLYPNYLTDIISLLPNIHTSKEAKVPKGAFALSYIEDMKLIDAAYDTFLEKNSLYEPNRELKNYTPSEKKYAIYYPELIEDFSEFRKVLEENPKVFSIITLPNADPEIKLNVYNSYLTEIRNCLDRVYELYTIHKVPLEEIILTVPSSSSYLPYLEREARMRGLPLKVRMGKVISDYSEGRLFSSIADCVNSSFSLDSLKALLLNGSFPWKSEEKRRAIALVEYGMKKHIVSSWYNGENKKDSWELNFSIDTSFESRSNAAFYRSIKKLTEECVFAPDFETLKAALVKLERSLFNPEEWNEGSRIIERAISELSELDIMQKRLCLTIPNVYSLFLKHLEEVQYVYQSKKGGINVYDYRVSALLNASYHFILGSSDKAIRVQYSAMKQMRKDVSECFDFIEKDASSDFIKAYAFSDSETVFSVSLKGPDAVCIAHSYFIANTKTVQTNEHKERAHDPYVNEFKYFTSGVWPTGTDSTGTLSSRAESSSTISSNTKPSGVLPSLDQREAYLKFCKLQELHAKEAEYLQNTNINLAEFVNKRFIVKDTNLMKLSFTFIDRYLQCPWHAYLKSILYLEELPEEPEIIDSLLIGKFYHRVLDLVFKSLKEDFQVIDGMRIDTVKSKLPEIVRKVLEEMALEEGYVPSHLLDLLFSNLSYYVQSVLDFDKEHNEAWTISGIEQDFVLELLDSNTKLIGTIDRVLEKDKKVRVLDYKKSTTGIETPKKINDFIQDLGNMDFSLFEYPSSAWQLPFYLLALQNDNLTPDLAGYWALESSLYKDFFGNIKEGDSDKPSKKSFIQSGNAPNLFAFVKSLLSLTSSSLRAGDFHKQNKDKAMCVSCKLKTVCRKPYFMESKNA